MTVLVTARRTPVPRLWRNTTALTKLAARLNPQTAAAFTEAVQRLQGGVNKTTLRQAVASGNLSAIESAAGAGRIQAIMLGDDKLYRSLLGVTQGAGRLTAQGLTAAGISTSFTAAHPNVTMLARTQVGNLVTDISRGVRQSIRSIVALGNELGITVDRQAQAIQSMVGLPANWAEAPLRFGQELSNGVVNPHRLLRRPAMGATAPASAYVDQLRRGVAEGRHLDPEWVDQQVAKYTEYLTQRRANNIARTENIRAATAGQHESWKQAVQSGDLPATVRRIPLVTDDERLRPDHRAIPAMNPNGRRLDEPYQTPMGPMMGPPFGVNCRCGEGLEIPPPAAPSPTTPPSSLGGTPGPEVEAPPPPVLPTLPPEQPVGGLELDALLNETALGHAQFAGPERQSLAVYQSDSVEINRLQRLGGVDAWVRDRQTRFPWLVGDAQEAHARQMAARFATHGVHVASAIGRSPGLSRPATVYRGIGNAGAKLIPGGKELTTEQQIQHLLGMESLSDTGFVSTTTRKSVATGHFAKGERGEVAVIMQMTVPRGTKGVWMPKANPFAPKSLQNERELLLGPGTMVVRKAELKVVRGRYQVHMTVDWEHRT